MIASLTIPGINVIGKHKHDNLADIVFRIETNREGYNIFKIVFPSNLFDSDIKKVTFSGFLQI